jgi:MFS family permease
MGALKARFNYLFRSTKGLILVAIALIALITAIWGMISGPMAEFGVRDLVIRTFGMDIVEAEREGRIVLLYHAIAMAVVAIEVYIITAMVPMEKHQQTNINAIITFGYILSLIFGMLFGYFGHNFIFHGLYLLGLSLMFFGGLQLAIALWPLKKEYHVKDQEYSHTRSGIDLERVAFFTMAVATLGSAVFGAVTGSYWGNGHETFLAEDIIREPSKTLLQKSIIGHLHIMLTLIAIAITLIVGRWQDFKGTLHKLAMPFMIVGTIIISLGAWLVVVVDWAHTIIYGGSVLVMLAALFFVIFSWNKLIRSGLKKPGITKVKFSQKISALLEDPLKFGVGWQMVFMNFTVSGVGIFMAVKLDEIFRVWPHRDERIILTGHWHILSGIIATIILLYYADLAGLKGRIRKIFGWSVIIFSNIAFASVTIFSMKRLFVSESAQQPLVNWTMLLADLGLALVLVALAILMIWRLVDLFKRDGRWSDELNETGYDKPPDNETKESVELAS